MFWNGGVWDLSLVLEAAGESWVVLMGCLDGVLVGGREWMEGWMVVAPLMCVIDQWNGISSLCFVMQTSIRLVVYQAGPLVRWSLDLCAGTCKCFNRPGRLSHANTKCILISSMKISRPSILEISIKRSHIPSEIPHCIFTANSSPWPTPSSTCTHSSTPAPKDPP